MADGDNGQFGSGLNLGSDQQPPSPPQSSGFGSSFFGPHAGFLGNPQYDPTPPGSSPLDMAANQLRQQAERAQWVATNPWAQIFGGADEARNAIPQIAEKLQTIQKQKADIAAGRQQAQMLGLDPGEVSDQATRDDRIAAAQQRALGGDLKAFQGLQAVEPKAAEAIQDQVHSAISRNLDTAQNAFDSLSNVKTQDEYAAALGAMRSGGDLKNLEALGLKMPGQLDAFNAAKGREAQALRNARIGVDTIRQRLEDRNTYQPMPEAEAKTYTNRLTTAYGDKFDNGTWSRNSAAGTRGYVVNGAANPSDLGRTFTLGSADQRKQFGDQADQLVPKAELEKFRFFNRTARLATYDDNGNYIPSTGLKGPNGEMMYINTNPNVQQGIAEGFAGMLRGGTGSANIGLMKLETSKRGFIQGLIDKINTENAAAINELKGADVNPYLSRLTQQQVRSVMDVLTQYNNQSVGNRMNAVAERAGALGFDSSALGLAKGEGGGVDDAVERGRQAQIARMSPSHQAIGGGDGVFQIGAQRPGAGATGTPEGSNKTTQIPGAAALRTPVQQANSPPPAPPQGPGATQGVPNAGASSNPTRPMRPDGTPSPPVGGSAPGRSGLPPGMKLDNSQALDAAANRTIQMESGFKPGQQTGSYVGLGQWSKSEMLRHGITDPDDVEQTRTALKADIQDRTAKLTKDGFPATASNVYLMHQQGEAGLEAHLRNPDSTAWENLKPYYRTDSLAKQAVWGNMTPTMRAQFPNGVSSVTSGDFTRLWDARYNGTDMPTGAAAGARMLASGSAEPPPLSANQRAPRMTEAESVSKNYDEMPWYKKAVAGLLFGRDTEGGVEAAKRYGPEGGSIVGSSVGPLGGAAGGAGGQVLKDWFSGNPQNPTEIAKQAGLGLTQAIAPAGRPVVGALARAAGGAAVEGGAKAAEGGDAGDIAGAAMEGAEGSALGSAAGEAIGVLGRFVGFLGREAHQFVSRFTQPEQKKLFDQGAKLTDANKALKEQEPKLPATAQGAALDNPKYVQAEKDAADATAELKAGGHKPDDIAYAADQARQGATRGEASMGRPLAAEKAALGQEYQAKREELEAAPLNQMTKSIKGYAIPDGPTSIIRTAENPKGKIDAAYEPDALHAQMLASAPAGNPAERWGNVEKAQSELLGKERDAYAAGDTTKATAMRTMATSLRGEQRRIVSSLLPENRVNPFMDELDGIDKRYATVMQLSDGIKQSKLSTLLSKNTPESREFERNFRQIAAGDTTAIAALNAVKADARHSVGQEGKLIGMLAAGELATNAAGVPTLGAVTASIAARRFYTYAGDYLRAKMLGRTVKFADFFAHEASQQSPLLGAVGAQIGVRAMTPGSLNPVGSAAASPTEQPPLSGARKASDGHWYVNDQARPGKYLRVLH